MSLKQFGKTWEKWTTGQKVIAGASAIIFILALAFIIREAGWFGVNGPGEPGYRPELDQQLAIGQLLEPKSGQTVGDSFTVKVHFKDPNSDMVWSKVSYRIGSGSYKTFMSKVTYGGVYSKTRTKTFNYPTSLDSYKVTFKMEAGDARGKDSINEKTVTLYTTKEEVAPDENGVPAGLDVPGFPILVTLATIIIISKKLRRNRKNDSI